MTCRCFLFFHWWFQAKLKNTELDLLKLKSEKAAAAAAAATDSSQIEITCAQEQQTIRILDDPMLQVKHGDTFTRFQGRNVFEKYAQRESDCGYFHAQLALKCNFANKCTFRIPNNNSSSSSDTESNCASLSGNLRLNYICVNPDEYSDEPNSLPIFFRCQSNKWFFLLED